MPQNNVKELKISWCRIFPKAAEFFFGEKRPQNLALSLATP
jgi:hypothetical protein